MVQCPVVLKQYLEVFDVENGETYGFSLRCIISTNENRIL